MNRRGFLAALAVAPVAAVVPAAASVGVVASVNEAGDISLATKRVAANTMVRWSREVEELIKSRTIRRIRA